MNFPPHLVTAIPLGSVPVDRTTQAILAIRQADASGLPHFADALARNLRAEIGADPKRFTLGDTDFGCGNATCGV